MTAVVGEKPMAIDRRRKKGCMRRAIAQQIAVQQVAYASASRTTAACPASGRTLQDGLLVDYSAGEGDRPTIHAGGLSERLTPSRLPAAERDLRVRAGAQVGEQDMLGLRRYCNRVPYCAAASVGVAWPLAEHQGVGVLPVGKWVQPSLSTSGETLTVEQSMTSRARTENA
jgi:hypothetical protein